MFLVICYLRLKFHAQCNNMNIMWKGLVYCHSDFGWLILIFNLRVFYVLDTNVAAPLAINFIYSGQEDISCIFKGCYTVCFTSFKMPVIS
jgi:hypothetical protein